VRGHARLSASRTNSKTSPGARLIGPEVKLTIEQNYAGLTPADLALLKEVITAIEAGLPNAANRPPGEVFEFVLEALRRAWPRTSDIRMAFYELSINHFLRLSL
jgi:hypothetical protein